MASIKSLFAAVKGTYKEIAAGKTKKNVKKLLAGKPKKPRKKKRTAGGYMDYRARKAELEEAGEMPKRKKKKD